jgi:hypothetical protein
MSYAAAVKGPEKIVFNLVDVNKAPELIKDVPPRAMFYQKYDKRFSIYMVDHAYAACHLNNFINGAYPKPYPKKVLNKILQNKNVVLRDL